MKLKPSIIIFLLLIAVVITACTKQQIKPQKVFGQIVFVSNRNGEKQLFTMDSKGEKQRLVAKFNNQMIYPSFSPNGKLLLFFSLKNKPDIWLINKLGKVKNFTNTPKEIEKFANFSPDGKKIAYSKMFGKGINFDIISKNTNGSAYKRLTFSTSPDSNPLFAPDGKTIYWTAQKMKFGLSEIARMDADGKNKKQLTFNDVEDGVDSISSDGKWLVSSAVRDDQWEIMIYSNDGNRQIRVTNDKEYDTRAFWQPRGNKIFWQKKTRGDNFNLFITEFPDLKIRNLTKNKGSNIDAQWTSDGRIIFASNRDGDYEIYIMNNDGTNLRQLTHNDYEDRMPVWRPN